MSEVERGTPASGRVVHPIEARSYEILRSRVDLSGLPPLRRAVAERVIHASADLQYATDLVADEADLEHGLRALRAGAPVVADVAMVAAGITGRETVCSIADPAAARTAARTGLTRSAAAVRVSYARVGPGAVWVVGCAPTALAEIIAFGVEPALVIGLPVGFVGAAESKEALRAGGLPAVSNISEKGGSAVAAAALNALLYHVGEPASPAAGPATGTAGGPRRATSPACGTRRGPADGTAAVVPTANPGTPAEDHASVNAGVPEGAATRAYPSAPPPAAARRDGRTAPAGAAAARDAPDSTGEGRGRRDAEGPVDGDEEDR